jgi:hypothetical protein
MGWERGRFMTASNGVTTVVVGERRGLVDTAEERTRYRRSVLHLGTLFGWSQDEILLFAEAVGTRRWEELDIRDLLAVIHEYRALLQVLGAKLARQRCRAADSRRATEAYDGCGD